MKEIKDEPNRWRNIPCMWDQKNQYSENEYTTQSKLQIQCNPSNYNGIFHRTRTNNFTICMETQKASNIQSNIVKEEWNWGESIFLTSDYTAKLQLSRQYSTVTKTEIEIS